MVNGGVNQPMFLHICLLQGVKQTREITRSLFAIRNIVLFLNCLCVRKYIFLIFTLKGEEGRSLMRGCHNLRFDCIQKYACLSEFSSFIFNQQNFTNRA